MSSSNDDTNHKDIVEDDLVDLTAIQIAQSSQTISPSSSHSSLKQLTSNYKSQSLQSMSQTVNNKDLKNQQNNSESNNNHDEAQNSISTHQYSSSSANNIMISLVNSEEESEDDNEINIESNPTLTKSKSLTQFSSYTINRSINNLNQVANNNQNNNNTTEQQENNNKHINRPSLVILYGESDEETNTQTNSYHNSSGSNSTSYNSLNNINNNSNVNNNNCNRSLLNKRSGSLSQKNIKSTSVGDLNKLASGVIEQQLVNCSKKKNNNINDFDLLISNKNSAECDVRF